MKVRALLITNGKDLDKAKDMGCEIDEEFNEFDIYIRPEVISWAYVSTRGDIVLWLGDESFVIEYDEDIWNKIKNHIGE